MEIGTGGGANSQLGASKSYVYNFGITAAGDGLELDQIVLGIGRQNNVNAPLVFEVFRGFGGNVAGNELVKTFSFDQSAFSGASTSTCTLSLPEALTLNQGAYSVRLSSTTTTNYGFRDGLLGLGGAGIVSATQWIQDSNTGGTASTTLTPQAEFVLADYSLDNTNINFGRFHVNTSPVASVSAINAAPATSDNVTESLTIAQGELSGAALVNSIPSSAINQGSSGQVSIGITPSVGAQSGTLQLNFSSVQEGSSLTRTGDPLSVGSRTIEVAGHGYTGQSEWVNDADGSWSLNNFSNWEVDGGAPGLDGVASVNDRALFGVAASSDRTITLAENSPSLRELIFDNSDASFTLDREASETLGLGNGSNAGSLDNRSGRYFIDLEVALGNDLFVSNAAASSTTIRGEVSGTGHGLTINGLGTLFLEGNNSYTGATSVASGKLMVNGSTSSSSLVTVEEGAILGGSGTVGGETTVFGTHAPGTSPGIQTFESGLTYATGSTFEWELIANTTEGRGSNFDGVDVTGGTLTFEAGVTSFLSFNSEGSTIVWSDPFWEVDRSWLVYTTTGSVAFASTSIFDEINLSVDSDGNSLQDVLGRANASFFWSQEGDNILLNYSVIPEPATYGLIISLLALGFATRRRRM